jgi:hypothetical protein
VSDSDLGLDCWGGRFGNGLDDVAGALYVTRPAATVKEIHVTLPHALA